jgi:hypothetical protein
MSNVHISIAAIAQLTATSPQAVHKALLKGTYGTPVRRGHNIYVPLATVEARLGQRISPEQVAHTATGNPARVVTITEE